MLVKTDSLFTILEHPKGVLILSQYRTQHVFFFSFFPDNEMVNRYYYVTNITDLYDIIIYTD